jgi:hypothetical protein
MVEDYNTLEFRVRKIWSPPSYFDVYIVVLTFELIGFSEWFSIFT